MKKDLKQIEKLIASTEGCLLFFSVPDCGVCQVWKPKVFTDFEKHFPEMLLIEIDISSASNISARFGVFTAPILLVFFEGKEYFRESKNVDLNALLNKIERIKSLMEA